MYSARMKTLRSRARRCLCIGSLPLLLVLLPAAAKAQQFNSDNWWVLPDATGMGILSLGQEYSTMYLGYGFLPGWELDAAATIYENDADNSTAGYSTTVYVKRLLFQDEAQTKGAAVMLGVGQGPGYLDAGVLTQDFRNYWVTVPVTVPLFDNKLSWDLMPGGTWNKEYGAESTSAAGFTYSTRMNLYGIIPHSAIVAEVFGAEGDASAPAQYKAGVRWESKFVIVALTYGDGLEGNGGGGIELGLMVFTLPYR